MKIMLYVGTSGTSAWFSHDRGDFAWIRPNSHSGLYNELRIWCLSSHPRVERTLLAGTDLGLFRWDEFDQHWAHLASPMDGICIWALAQAPDDPDIILAGTRPAGIFRSENGGKSWSKIDVAGLATFCGANAAPTRITQILFDPFDPLKVWASVEIDGIYHSHDGGLQWQAMREGLVSTDVHGIAAVRNGAKRLFATTNKGLHRSDDDGESWHLQPLDSPWQYTRAIIPRADGKVLFLTNGNGPPGSTGRLLRSRDNGDHWDDVHLPGRLNSTVWCVATHPADPDLIFACTNLGQLFRSEDGGARWIRLDHEFGDIRALHWRPAVPEHQWKPQWWRDGRPW